jgi:NDP-sugar pyrophosphorylase family protein
MSDISTIPAAILAGGLATRLGRVTQTTPKALLVVAGRPFIDHQLDLLRQNGIREVVLCLGHLGEMVRRHVGEGRAFGVRVQYSFDGDQLLGTGGAIRRALPMLGNLFWVMYGDSYMDISYPAVLEALDARPEALGLMTILQNEGRWDKSNVLFAGGRLLRYDKKTASPEMRHIDYGVALLRRRAAERIGEGKCDLADLYSEMVSRGEMIGYEVSRRFYEIGTPASLAEADAYLTTRLTEIANGGGAR